LGLEVTWRAPEARSIEVFDHIRSGAARPLDPGTRIAILLDGAPDTDVVGEVAAFAPDLDVVAVPVYRWELPEDPGPARRLIGAGVERAVDAVTFTSSHAVTNFAVIVEEMGLTDEVRRAFERGDVLPVAVGPVTAARIVELDFTTPVEPRTFRLGAMVQSLAER